MKIGEYVITTTESGRWSDQKYAGQRGIIVGYLKSVRHWQVVMDDPTLHDRIFEGQEVAAFDDDTLSVYCYVIEEESV